MASQGLSAGALIDAFAATRPVGVMARATLERILDPIIIDELFRQAAEQQYERTLLFSDLLQVLASVVLKQQPSLNAAWQAVDEEMTVSRTAFYNKLNRTELPVSAALVRHAADRAAEAIRTMRAEHPSLLPGSGYRIRMIDGHHPAATEHRLDVLRTVGDAPLPGKTVAIYDPRREIIEDVFLTRDGHANEQGIVDWEDRFASLVHRGDLWIADRGYCGRRFVGAVLNQGADVLVRQTSRWQGELIGQRRKIGKSATRTVYEQAVRLQIAREPLGKKQTTGREQHADDRAVTLRRITVELKTPTRHGDTELHLFTSVPATKASAQELAELYAQRWKMETVFFEIDRTLHGEIPQLGCPEAALLAMCLAFVMFNALSVLQAAMRRRHGRAKVFGQVSPYYLALEISQIADGLSAVVPDEAWHAYRDQAISDFVHHLDEWAGQMKLSRYRKHTRGEKKPPPPRNSRRNGHHVSTAKLIDKSTR